MSDKFVESEPRYFGNQSRLKIRRRSRIALLRQIEGPGAPRDIPLALGRTFIGRSPDAQVHVNDDSALPVHAVVLRWESSCACVALSSNNELYVNSEQVPLKELFDGDSIRIGATLFIYFELTQ